MSYTKLYTSILDSTIWREPHTTRIVWITMLAMSDHKGLVEASVPGLADRARVTLQECKEALQILSSPDEYSRTKYLDGVRIQEVEGGWMILNREKYRDKDKDRTEYWRQYKAEKRSKMSTNVHNVHSGHPHVHTCPHQITQEEEEEKEQEENKKERGVGEKCSAGAEPATKEKTQKLVDDGQWLESIIASPAYQGVDVRRELEKMRQWCIVRNLKPSRRRLVNWLNRAEKPIQTYANNNGRSSHNSCEGFKSGAGQYLDLDFTGNNDPEPPGAVQDMGREKP